jgi:MoxR-like ATPase
MHHFISHAGITDLNTLPDPPEIRRAFGALRDLIRSDPNAGKAAVVGQDELIDRFIIAFIAGGHILLEGVPGVNKSRLASRFGTRLGLRYGRIQCTPDLQPQDIITVTSLEPDKKHPDRLRIFEKLAGVFQNILLVDEINRASTKAQSALFEAMAEGTITPLNKPTRVLRPLEEWAIIVDSPRYFGIDKEIDPKSFEGHCFMMLATQNPIDHEGVYRIPYAQEDRFMFKLLVPEPPMEDYLEITQQISSRPSPPSPPHVGDKVGDPMVPMEEQAASAAEKIGQDEKTLWAQTLYFMEGVRRNLFFSSNGDRSFDRKLKSSLVRDKWERLIQLSGLPALGGGSQFAARRDLARDKKYDEFLKEWEKEGGEKKKVATSARELSAQDTWPEIESGAGPRGLMNIVKAAFARNLFLGNASTWSEIEPTWEDVKAVAPDILRHRIRLAPGATAQGTTTDDVVAKLLEIV